MSSITSILNEMPAAGPGSLNIPISNPTLPVTAVIPTPGTSDNSTKIASTAFVRNAISSLEYYYKEAGVYQSVATNGASYSALIFDTSGNLYWAMMNSYNGTTGNITSYVYKITPAGTMTTFASVATNEGYPTDLKFDTSGNLYWAVCDSYNTSIPSYNITSYVYKITPAGTMTTFASVATNDATGTSLVFDTSGNLYWAVTNHYNGTTHNLTSYVYKITPAGTLTTFASVATSGAYDDGSLIFDASGNLYWAVANSYNGTTYNLTSYVYKITPTGTMTTFASVATIGGSGTSLVFDASGNLYWAVSNYYNGTTYNFTSYVYKITPTGTLTTFASVATNGAQGASLVFDVSGNLYWAVANRYNGTTYNLTSYVYKITSAGTQSTIASRATNGGICSSLIFDNNQNLYWSVPTEYNGTTYNLTSYLYRLDKQTA